MPCAGRCFARAGDFGSAAPHLNPTTMGLYATLRDASLHCPVCEGMITSDWQFYFGGVSQLLREVIKAHGDADPRQRVTLFGDSCDVIQHKEVIRWPRSPPETIGEVWYDLNIDGLASDLTATFDICEGLGGLTLVLNDIHLM